jgi:hypothetical protein
MIITKAVILCRTAVALCSHPVVRTVLALSLLELVLPVCDIAQHEH